MCMLQVKWFVNDKIVCFDTIPFISLKHSIGIKMLIEVIDKFVHKEKRCTVS